MKCRICEVRKPRRYCPATAGEICSLCCGAEREVTLRCPLDCVYLQEAHTHETLEGIPPDRVPSPDIRITDDFIDRHMRLVDIVGAIICDAAVAEPDAVDTDVQEALDATVRTWRTLQSGLYYETRPANLIAAHIQGRVQEQIAALRKELASKGAPAIPDATFLGVLVFFHRLSVQYDNHRRYGRSFIGSFGEVAEAPGPGSSPLILPA